MAVQKFSVSMRDELVSRIDARGENRSFVIGQSLERYFDLMARERYRLAEMLSDAEVALICDAFNGTAFYDTVSVMHAAMNVADAIEMDRLDEKWQVNGPALVAKLDGAGYGAMCALVDAVTAWWERVAQGEQPPATVAEVFRSESRNAGRYPYNVIED